MTTLTVTEVLSRSIICSWVSVTAATLQISTSLLPCRSPACQAKPYSSTCGPDKREKHEAWFFMNHMYQHCWREGREKRKYLSNGAIQADVEAQLPQTVSPQGHVHRLAPDCQQLRGGQVGSAQRCIYRTIRGVDWRTAAKTSPNNTTEGVFFWISAELTGSLEISFS